MYSSSRLINAPNKEHEQISDSCWFLQEQDERVNDLFSLFCTHSSRLVISASFVFVLGSPSFTSLIIAAPLKENSDAPRGLIDQLLMPLIQASLSLKATVA